MILEALDKFYPQNKMKHRLSLKAFCSENDLIPIMQQMPTELDFSSLPQINADKRAVVISVASYKESEAKHYFNLFIQFLQIHSIQYSLEDY